MKTVSFTIPGEPVAKARPRVGKFGTYTPKKTANYENLVKLFFVQAKCPKLEGELHMCIKAYFTIPKSKSKKMQDEMRNEKIHPTKKPDLSNIIKIVEDALNKEAYDDDSQIIETSAKKYYSDFPRVEVEIRSLSAPNDGENSP